MLDIKDIRHDLINIIMKIDDVEKLNSIYNELDRESKIEKESSLSVENALTSIRSKVSLDEIVEEQGIDQITYSQIRKISGDIEWEHSIEELLKGLD